MWQQQHSIRSEASDEKHLDSTQVDSGFLSGSNLVSTELTSDLEQVKEIIPAVVAPEPMRPVDSGLDIGLTETLSHLSLKQVTLDCKIQSEADLELTPVSVVVDDATIAAVKQGRLQSEIIGRKNYLQEPWEDYYKQDDEGDT